MVHFSTLLAGVAALAAVSNAAPNRHGLWARHGHKLVNRQAYGGYLNDTDSSAHPQGPTGTGVVTEAPVYVTSTSTIKSYTTTCVTLTYTLGNGRPVVTTITKTIPVETYTATATQEQGQGSPQVPSHVAPVETEPSYAVEKPEKPTYEETSPIVPSDGETSPVAPEKPTDDETSPVSPEKPVLIVTVTATVTETASASQCACPAEVETPVVSDIEGPVVPSVVVPQYTPGPKPPVEEDQTTTVAMTKTYTKPHGPQGPYKPHGPSKPHYGHGPYYNGTHPGVPSHVSSYGPGPVGPTGSVALPSHSEHPAVPSPPTYGPGPAFPSGSGSPVVPSQPAEPSYSKTVTVMPIYETAAPSAAPSSAASPEQPQAPTYGRRN